MSSSDSDVSEWDSSASEGSDDPQSNSKPYKLARRRNRNRRTGHMVVLSNNLSRQSAPSLPRSAPPDVGSSMQYLSIVDANNGGDNAQYGPLDDLPSELINIITEYLDAKPAPFPPSERWGSDDPSRARYEASFRYHLSLIS